MVIWGMAILFLRSFRYTFDFDVNWKILFFFTPCLPIKCQVEYTASQCINEIHQPRSCLFKLVSRLMPIRSEWQTLIFCMTTTQIKKRQRNSFTNRKSTSRVPTILFLIWITGWSLGWFVYTFTLLLLCLWQLYAVVTLQRSLKGLYFWETVRNYSLDVSYLLPTRKKTDLWFSEKVSTIN